MTRHSALRGLGDGRGVEGCVRVFRVRIALWEGLHTTAVRGSRRCDDDRVT